MSLSRREMLLASLGLFAGCAQQAPQASSGSYARPHTAWPETYQRRPQAMGMPTPVLPPQQQVVRPPVQPVASPVPNMPVIPRSTWTSAGPIRGREINPMNGVQRITVHHEGWTPIFATDQRTIASRIEDIRGSHTGSRRWSDIGYHYVVDRAGRIWEGRNIRFQGAHVSKNNEHNVGIMVLGNFDRQSPSGAQLDALRLCLRSLMKTYGVSTRRVYTHQELMPTACPGRALQPRIASLRSNGYLA